MAKRWNAATSCFDTTTPKAAFPPGITSIDCRSVQIDTARYCRRSWPGRAPTTSLQAATSFSSPRAIAARTTLRARSAGVQGRACGDRGGKEVIERGLRVFQPTSGEPGAVLALHHLLERQHYRLAYWRLAGSDINYRRFFDINALAGLRVEDAGAFPAIHALVGRLIAKGCLHGLRLDHIDGLRDPHQYFRRLQRLIDLQMPSGNRRFTWLPKRSLPMASASRALPASQAPPAMNGST